MKETKETRRTGQTGAAHKYLWIIPIVIILLLMGGYAFGSSYYASRFESKTSINGIDVSGMSAGEAAETLNSYYSKQSFTLLENGSQWQEIKFSDLGVTADFSEDVAKALKEQNQWAWGVALFSKTALKMDVLALDQDKLNTALEGLKTQISSLNEGRTQTQDATLIKSDSGFTVQAEVQGNSLDVEAIIAAISQAISQNETSLELEDYLQKPAVTAEDPSLKEKEASLNKVGQINASYLISGNTFQIPTATIMDWLIFENGAASLDNDKVRAYVEELGNQYNTSTISTDFNSTRRGTVTIPAGTYSWTIQTDQEVEELKTAILAGEDFTRTPVIAGSAAADQALIGNTYIEVDLENQHMWYYKDGSLVLETDIVSGKPSTPTPAGVFYIWNKERNATLVGEDYQTPVDHWMPIDWEGVGIHDSPWQSAYGGDRYLTYGSHGCINTPPSVMSQLYDQVETTTPVLVF